MKYFHSLEAAYAHVPEFYCYEYCGNGVLIFHTELAYLYHKMHSKG